MRPADRGITLTGLLPSLDVPALARFEPHRNWFLRPPTGIHGIEHEARVLVLGQLLAEMESAAGANVSAHALAWAAVIHDTQRVDDGVDPQHGTRAAEWIRSRPGLLPDKDLVDAVSYLCHWHVPEDEEAPLLTAELRTFKDADALDRWRIDDLDPAYLRTESSRLLLDFSRRLWRETEGVGTKPDAFRRILTVADRLLAEDRFAARQ